MNKVRTNCGKENDKNRDYWGYVVCFGTAITFIAGIGHVNSFGIIYKDFMIETQSSAKSMTTGHGVFAMMLAIGGIILNLIKKRISLQQGGLIGAMLFTLGSFTTIAITSTNQLPITFGVLQGLGFGMMVPVSYSTLNKYFVEKRTTVMSAIKAAQGIILMWYPQLLKLVIGNYGFRGTLLVISGISLHTIPGMLVMKDKITTRTANNLEDGLKDKEAEDLLKKEVQEGYKDVNSENVKPERSLRKRFIEFFNLKPLQDPIFRNICIGQSFVNFSDLTFFILQPMLLYQYGYDTSAVATCISICAGADLAGRCTLAFISSITPTNTRVLYFTASLLTFVLRIVILQIRGFIWVALATASLGVLRSMLHVTSPLVIADHVTHDDFPGAYALSLLCAGVVNIIISPVIGQLKDMYQDYIPAFYALSACCLPCLVIWPLEYFLNYKSQNK